MLATIIILGEFFRHYFVFFFPRLDLTLAQAASSRCLDWITSIRLALHRQFYEDVRGYKSMIGSRIQTNCAGVGLMELFPLKMEPSWPTANDCRHSLS